MRPQYDNRATCAKRCGYCLGVLQGFRGMDETSAEHRILPGSPRSSAVLASESASRRKSGVAPPARRAATAVPTEKSIREDIGRGRPNRVTLSPHGRDAQDGAGDAALAVPVALTAPGRDPRASTTAHRLAPHGAEARPPEGRGPAAVRAALSALARHIGFDRPPPAGHDRALAPTWLQSPMAVEVPTPSGQTRHS